MTERTCETCKHSDVISRKSPCAECLADDCQVERPLWEPANQLVDIYADVFGVHPELVTPDTGPVKPTEPTPNLRANMAAMILSGMMPGATGWNFSDTQDDAFKWRASIAVAQTDALIAALKERKP